VLRPLRAFAIHGDCWSGVLSDDWNVEDPSWDDVSKAIQRLDAKTFTMVTIEGPWEQHLAVGGGAGRHVVYATFDNYEFWSLLGHESMDGTVLLTAGGQEGDFPARRIVDLDQARIAARAFFIGLQLEPSLRWAKH
jgi:hypothetical protein